MAPNTTNKEVHGKAQPDEQTRTTVSPHLANHIVDDVTYGEHNESSRHVSRSKRNLFCLQYVCRNQAHAKQYAVKHKQHTDSLIVF